MAVTAKPILPRFGAEVSGVDITKPLDEATKREIIATQDKWGVTVWRNTGLNDETHVAFSRIFGHLETLPESTRPTRHRFREIFDASNLDFKGEIITDELVRKHKAGDRLWHTDSSFIQLRSAYSLLLCYEAPPEGGQTWFADTRSAYDDLPQAMKEKVENLRVRHSLWWSRKMAGYPFTEEEIDAKPHAEHPLVHVHRGSGRKALYVAAHGREVVGMPREEGRALLKELIDWCTQPQYVFSVSYAPGDMVIWDNLCSMHRGGDFDDLKYRRDMQRTTVREGEPPKEKDDPFGELFRNSGMTGISRMAQNARQPAQ